MLAIALRGIGHPGYVRKNFKPNVSSSLHPQALHWRLDAERALLGTLTHSLLLTCCWPWQSLAAANGPADASCSHWQARLQHPVRVLGESPSTPEQLLLWNASTLLTLTTAWLLLTMFVGAAVNILLVCKRTHQGWPQRLSKLLAEAGWCVCGKI